MILCTALFASCSGGLNEMKKYMFAVIAVCFMLSCATCVLASEKGFVPQWNVGERWVVEASYRDQLNEDSADVWLTPVEWIFRVRAIRDIEEESCYVVHIYPRNNEMRVQAVLWLAVSDLRPLRVIDIFPTTDGVGNSRRDFHPDYPEPLSSIDSLIPYDLPIFPLRQVNTSLQGADGFDAYRREPEKTRFNSFSRVGGMSFRRSVGQSNRPPERQYSDAFAAYRGGGNQFQVELTNARDGQTMTQLWQEGSPWAISVETRDLRARLLPPSAPTPLPGQQDNDGGSR